MTTKVSVPVLDAPEVATWLATNTNDLKTYIDAGIAPAPVLAEVGSYYKAIAVGIAGWAPLPVQNVPTAAGAGVDRRVPRADAAGVVTWNTLREVPAPLTPDEDDFALIANDGTYAWEKRTDNLVFFKVFAFYSDHVTLQSQGYLPAQLTGPQIWTKPAWIRDTDWVVISAVGGGGGGGLVWCHITGDNFFGSVNGGHGGGYLEWVLPASDLESTMLVFPGAAGTYSSAQVNLAPYYGGTSGHNGQDSVVEPVDIRGGTISSINIDGTSPALFVTATAHGLTTGQPIVIYGITQTGPGTSFTAFNNNNYSVVVTSTTAFTLKYVGSGLDVIPAVPPGGSAYTTGTGKVCAINKSMFVANGGPGGEALTFLSSAGYPSLKTTGGTFQGKKVIAKGLNSAHVEPDNSFFNTGTLTDVVFCGGTGAAAVSYPAIDNVQFGNPASSLHAGNGGGGTYSSSYLHARFTGSPGAFPGGGGGSSASVGTSGPATLFSAAGANGKITIAVYRGNKPRGMFQTISP